MISHISVVIITRNEEKRIARALKPLSTEFSDIRIVDSASDDATARIARGFGAQITDFHWNGRYPKKYQWCLENLEGLNDWVLFVDADEVVTPDLVAELGRLRPVGAGYMIGARYSVGGKVLRHGIVNRKIALVNRHKMMFPVVNDLDIKDGASEVEGHYQPQRRPYFRREKIGRLSGEMVHFSLEDEKDWVRKHERYAHWEAEMNRRHAWPRDPFWPRQIAKLIFRMLPFRPLIAFFHSYVWKLGFLDGRGGLKLARSRYLYYGRIGQISRAASDASKNRV